MVGLLPVSTGLWFAVTEVVDTFAPIGVLEGALGKPRVLPRPHLVEPRLAAGGRSYNQCASQFADNRQGERNQGHA